MTEPEGFKGKKNVYVCKDCGEKMVSVDRDKGVTPFTVACVWGCRAPGSMYGGKGTMYSNMYRVPQNLTPSHEWYTPDEKEISKIENPNVIEHVKMGGLLLRPTAQQP